MDRIRDRDHVTRLPVRDREELKRKEDIFDRQALLNESWKAYIARTEQHGREEEEHEKWVTETWEEFERRKQVQRAYLAAAEQKSEEEKRKEELAAKARETTSNDTILRLMKFRDYNNAKKLKSVHHLYADFDEYQQIKFIRQQKLLQQEEEMLRSQITLWSEAEMHMFHELFNLSGETAQAFQRLREQQQAVIDLEAQEAIARRKILNEEASEWDHLFNAEMEERMREEAELRKRLERKQREEEKRMKARAQQEKRRSEAELPVPTEIPAPDHVEEEKPVPPPDEEPEPEPAPAPAAAEAEDEEVPTSSIAFTPLEGNTVIELFKSATKILASAGDSSYIIRVDKNTREVMVICQNGIFIGEKGMAAPLLGKTILTGDCISAISPKLHSLVSFETVETYADSGCERIPDVTAVENCLPFIGNDKQQEELILFPIKRRTDTVSEFVLAFNRNGANSVADGEYDNIAQLAFDLCGQYNNFAQKKINSGLCQQCVDWINATTGCDAVYISLFEEPEVLTYVAATASHKFMIGKTHSSIDEQANGGISYSLLSTKKPTSLTTDDVALPLAAPYDQNRIRYFKEGEEKHGALMAIAIAGSNGVTDEALGVLFLDFIGTKTKINEVHKQIATTACELLADLLLGRSTASPDVKLKIEEVCPEGASDFLKALWSKSIQSLNEITPNQLLELAKYLRPPPVVPLVVQSTLLVVLGVKPQKVSAWEDARKRVTKELLTKMRNFDPTNLKARKKDFFIRARKQLKGYTATDVFEKGSYPTQCFFSWVFTAILLRKQAEKIHQQGSAFLWDRDKDDRESTYSAETNGMNIEEDDGEDDGEDDDEVVADDDIQEQSV